MRVPGTLVAVRRLQTMVEVTALAIQERVARIHDALHGLHDLTLSLFSTTERSPQSVAQWLEASGFGTDAFGYFERIEILRKARAGDFEAQTQIYYAQPSITGDAEALHRMYSLRGIADLLGGLNARLPELAWMYYQDATDFSCTYPMHDPCTVVPPDFDWHEYHTYLSVLPGVNPRREIRWTPPNIDYGGKGLMVAPSIPLYRGDTLIGVWSFDVPVAALIEECMSASGLQEQEIFIVGLDGMVVAHPSLDPLKVRESGEVVRMSVSELEGYETLDLAALRVTGRATVVDRKGVRRLVVARQIPALDWWLVASVPEHGLMGQMKRSFAQAFEHVRQGDLEHRLGPLGEELQDVVGAYNEMVAEVQATLSANEKARRELERSRAKTRAIFDGAPVGLVVLRPDRQIVDVNAEFGRLTGGAASSLIGGDLLSLVPEALRGRVAGELEDPEQRAGLRPIETEFDGQDGTRTPVRIVLRVFDLDGEPHLLAGVEDLTQRRSLQARLQHTQQIQAIGNLAAGVAHDFNNLLTSVVANTSLLRETLEDPDARQMTDAVLMAARTGSALTAQLLAISRRDIVQPRAVNFGQVLRESETLLQRLLDDDVELAFDVDGGLPNVWADPTQLTQVVLNLVINARDALGTKGRRIAVRLGPARERRALQLVVSDDGEGIPEELRERVFEAFFTTKSRGTGLGLATVRETVESLGGTVELESEVGRGTSVKVMLPFVESDDQAEVDRVPSAEIPVERIILVVDDEPIVRDVAVRILNRKGFSAQGFSDGESALSAIETLRGRVGLVLTDVVMPGMSGRELADAIHVREPSLPVLFMSGYTDDAIVRRGVEASKATLLRKPFRPEELVELVRAMMIHVP